MRAALELDGQTVRLLRDVAVDYACFTAGEYGVFTALDQERIRFRTPDGRILVRPDHDLVLFERA